jgi:ABC-type Fe3+/spermidine/putrescine transport system ATPase subunit
VQASGDEVVAEIGSGDTIHATRPELAATPGDRVTVLIRPEDISVGTVRGLTGARPSLAGVVTDISYHGDTFKLGVAVGDDVLRVKVARESGAGMQPGQTIFVTWKPDAVRILPAANRVGFDGDAP